MAGGDQVELSFRNKGTSEANITYSIFGKMATQLYNSYYFEFKNSSFPFFEFTVPKSSYSYFYNCNGIYTYETEAQVVGNIDLGYSINPI